MLNYVFVFAIVGMVVFVQLFPLIRNMAWQLRKINEDAGIREGLEWVQRLDWIGYAQQLATERGRERFLDFQDILAVSQPFVVEPDVDKDGGWMKPGWREAMVKYAKSKRREKPIMVKRRVFLKAMGAMA